MRAEHLLLPLLCMSCHTPPDEWWQLPDDCKVGRWTDELEFIVWSPNECIPEEERGWQTFEVDTCLWKWAYGGGALTPAYWVDTRTGRCLTHTADPFPNQEGPDDPYIRRCWETDDGCCPTTEPRPDPCDEEAP